MKIKEVIEGWRNTLFPPEALKDIIEKAAEERLHICAGCPMDSRKAEKDGNYKPLIRHDHHCLSCGCPLQSKTRCLSCSCPLNKWEALMTEEEENKIEST